MCLALRFIELDCCNLNLNLFLNKQDSRYRPTDVQTPSRSWRWVASMCSSKGARLPTKMLKFEPRQRQKNEQFFLEFWLSDFNSPLYDTHPETPYVFSHYHRGNRILLDEKSGMTVQPGYHQHTKRQRKPCFQATVFGDPLS